MGKAYSVSGRENFSKKRVFYDFRISKYFSSYFTLYHYLADGKRVTNIFLMPSAKIRTKKSIFDEKT